LILGRHEKDIMKKAALHNLGCKVNAYETDAMQQLLEEAGYHIVPFEEKADVYVINTCSVTGIADKKSRQMIHRAKKQNPQAIVVAAGCYVQTSPEAAGADAAVDILLGNNKKHRLIPMIREFEQRKQRKWQDDTRDNADHEDAMDIYTDHPAYEPLSVRKTGEHTRAFIKVQDGCNQFCTYCIIPYARGRVRSRSIEDVTKEVADLAAAGYREVVLTGIHLSSYGMTESYNLHPQDSTKLLELIAAVHQIPGIRRIRLGSLEPRIVTEKFAERLSRMDKICPHFHLSLQSGCQTTLQRMNRHYTPEEYEESCRILRKYFPAPAITTDVIVGFPGETEEEFAVTRQFLQKIAFYEMHIFKYSPRKGTRAYDMPEPVPEQIKNQRSAELLSLAQKMSESYRRSLSGKPVEALLETPLEIDGKLYYTGYTKEYIRVAVETKADLSNHIVTGILGEPIDRFFTFSLDYITIDDN
jgi:threonylcarbamoyladenosine tRNA methylthiotransferase MtaB